MSSNRAKGMRNERRAVKELENNGWTVFRVKGTTRFNKNADIFNLFDICSRRGKEIKWVQVKTNKKPKLDLFKDFYDKYCSQNESVEIWNYRDYKDKVVYHVK